MNRILPLIGVVLALLIIGAIYVLGAKGVDESITFDDVDITPGPDAIDQLAKGYITLPSITANEESIIDLIGSIAVKTQTEDGETWSYIYDFRPERDKVKISIIDELLFRGIVSVNAVKDT